MQIHFVFTAYDVEFIPWFLHFSLRVTVLVLKPCARMTRLAAVECVTGSLGYGDHGAGFARQNCQMIAIAIIMKIALVITVAKYVDAEMSACKATSFLPCWLPERSWKLISVSEHSINLSNCHKLLEDKKGGVDNLLLQTAGGVRTLCSVASRHGGGYLLASFPHHHINQ